MCSCELMEMENIMSFKRDFPSFVDALIRKKVFKRKYKKFKKYAIPRIESLKFNKSKASFNDQLFDATIFITANNIELRCPISINVTKLKNKVMNKPHFSFMTEDLYSLVCDDVKSETINSKVFSNSIPPIIIHDKCFGTQIVDGNHRIVLNKRNDVKETEAIVIKAEDLHGCLECDDFEVIIDTFVKMYSIIYPHKKVCTEQ